MPDGLLARVDEARGDVPRSLWVRWAMESFLGAPGSGPVLAQSAAAAERFFADAAERSPRAPLSRAEMFRRATQR